MRPAVPDNENQAPLSLAPSAKHGARILREWDNPNSGKANRGDQASLPPSAGPGDECAVEIEAKPQDPNIDVAVVNGQPTPLPVDSHKRELESDLKNPVFMSPDKNLPAAEQSRLSQPSSVLPLKFPYPPLKSDTRPDNARSTLPIVVDKYLVIASFICFLALLAYILPSLLLDTFSFHT